MLFNKLTHGLPHVVAPMKNVIQKFQRTNNTLYSYKRREANLVSNPHGNTQ